TKQSLRPATLRARRPQSRAPHESRFLFLRFPLGQSRPPAWRAAPKAPVALPEDAICYALPLFFRRQDSGGLGPSIAGQATRLGMTWSVLVWNSQAFKLSPVVVWHFQLMEKIPPKLADSLLDR